MNKKKIYIFLGVIVVLAMIGTYVGLNYKQVPILILNKEAGEIIYQEDLKTKYVWGAGEVLSEEELIGKETTSVISADMPIVSFMVKEATESALQKKPEVGETESTEVNNQVLVSVKLSSEQAPQQIKKGDRVYILTYYTGTSVPGQSAFSIVYPTIATVESTTSTLSSDGISSTLTGANILVDRVYSTNVLFGNIEGQTYLIQTTDETPVNFEGITAQKEFEKFFTTTPNVAESEFIDFEDSKAPTETSTPNIVE